MNSMYQGLFVDIFHRKKKVSLARILNHAFTLSSLHPQRPCSKSSLPSLATME